MLPNTRSLIILSILLLLTVNIVFLDIIFFSPQRQQLNTSISSTLPLSTSSALECSSTCKSFITDEVLRLLVSQAANATTPAQSLPGTTPAAPREYSISLGSGTTRKSDYDDLFGADAFVNMDNYPRIQKVIFEVYLRNPTGNGTAYAKLFNVTDKHDVWFSEVSMVGGGTARKEAVITLESGNKEYRVMLRSTLQYDVYVDNARIKITTY